MWCDAAERKSRAGAGTASRQFSYALAAAAAIRGGPCAGRDMLEEEEWMGGTTCVCVEERHFAAARRGRAQALVVLKLTPRSRATSPGRTTERDWPEEEVMVSVSGVGSSSALLGLLMVQ